MKYIIFGIISVLISINTSARETNSIRSSYELVGIGDSEVIYLGKLENLIRGILFTKRGGTPAPQRNISMILICRFTLFGYVMEKSSRLM